MTNSIEQRVINFINKYNLADKTIIVGFSGGYDSMCLLNILSELRELDDFINMKIIAVHFNHNWRGEEALKEQEVCKLFADSKGIEFYTKTAPEDIKKTENDARIARYEFFEDALDIFDGDAVFTAHNKEDNAETVLYRVIKGTGIYGLKGISERRGYFYRPLLKTSRAEILAYCHEHNLSPNNDSSNSNTKYKRNYLRLNIIPALEKVNSLIIDSLNTLADVATSENAIIEEYLSSIKTKIYRDDSIITSEYLKLSKPVKMRIIHEYLQDLGLDYDFKKISDIYCFIEQNIMKRNGNTISLAAAMWLYVDDKTIETLPRKSDINSNKHDFGQIKVNNEGEYKIGDKILTLKKYDEQKLFVFPDSTANFAYVDLSEIDLPMTIRTRQDGDIISPFGMSGTMKLKKYLNSKGINKHKRDDVILLTKDNEVLWAIGVGLSSKIGVVTSPTHVIEIK